METTGFYVRLAEYIQNGIISTILYQLDGKKSIYLDQYIIEDLVRSKKAEQEWARGKKSYDDK